MTLRQILHNLRQDDPKTLFKSKRDTDGRKMIVSKPDFSIVPYDKLSDYWHFVAWADTAERDLYLNDNTA